MKQHLSRAISFLLLFYCAALILIIAGDYTFSQAITALQISAPAVLLVCAFYPLLVSCGSNQDSVSNFTPGFSLSVGTTIWLGLLIPLALFWLLYHQVLQAWWSMDDPAILYYADAIGIWSSFYDPDRNYNFFAPLQIFSLGLDLIIAEFNPGAFYWHHLFSISLSLCLLYYLLNHFLSPTYSSMTLALFVVATPTSEVVHWLMVRHYAEGLALSLCALLFYVRALKSNNFQLVILGSLFYFASTLAKELYVPLVIVLPFLPINRMRQRVIFLIPYIGFAFLYLVMRFYMLGEQFLEGYRDAGGTPITPSWQDFSAFPQALMQAMGWMHWWQILVLIGVVGLIASFLFRSISVVRMSVLVWLVALVLPIVPVLWRIAELPYYLYVFSLGFTIATVFAIQHFKSLIDGRGNQHIAVISLFLCIFMVNLYPSILKQGELHDSMNLQRIHGEMLLASPDPGSVLVSNHYVARDLIYFRDKFGGASQNRPEEIAWCPVNDCLCASLYPNRNIIQWSGTEWQTNIPLNAQNCSNSSAELSIRISIELPQSLQWQFSVSPMQTGTFSVASTIDPYGSFLDVPYHELSVPAEGFTKLRFLRSAFELPFSWTVQFKSEEGWELVSAPVLIDPAVVDELGRAEFRWP